MRILIAAAGSRGDVAPYTGLGAELRRAGYDVVLATTETFAPLVRDAGLEFRSLPADPRGHGGVSGKRELMRTAAAFITDLGQGFAEAIADGLDLLLLSTTTAPLGWHVAEATGTPSIGVYIQPTALTGDFPPVVTGSRSLGRPANRMAGRFALRMTDRVFEQAVAKLRHRLQLLPASASAMRRRQEQENWPILHGFSTALVPRPSDWRSGLEIVGNWWPHHDPSGRLPADPCFGISKSTAHRRFLIWSRAGVWSRLHESVLHRLDDAGLIDITRVVLDTAHVRAKRGGEHTGPSPVDRGKPGSKMHILSDANGLPLLVGVWAGNTHDSEGLKPMIEGHQTRHDPHRGLTSSPSACTRTKPMTGLICADGSDGSESECGSPARVSSPAND